MRKHLDPTEIDIFSCRECNKKFDRKDAFQRHLQIHSKRARLDNEMDGLTKTRNDFHNASNEIPTPNRDIQMSIDTSDVEEAGHATPNIKTLKPKKSVSACNQEQEEWSKSTMQEGFPCIECDKVFTFQTNLYRHMKTHSQATRVKIAPVPFVHNPTTHSSAEEPMDQDVDQPSKTENNVNLSTEEPMALPIGKPTKIEDDIHDFVATEKAFQSRLITYELKHSITHTHEPHSYCYLIKDSLSSSDPIVRLYRGANAAKHFVESINKDVLKIGDKLYKERRMTPNLTPAEEAAHIAAYQCYICGLGFTSDKDPKVRDHMHSTPYTYRGAAHSSCNIRHQEQNTINCYFHNLSYDSHFIIKELGYDEREVSVIANSEEKYISFTKYIPYKKANRGVLKLRFVDTLRFLPSSLSKLADNLPNECFKETKRRFPDPTQFTLLTRKGVFPYSYISSVEKLQETQLPPRQAFYNKLTLETISEQDFKHAEDVWKAFNIKDLGQYSDLYLLTDVLLLTDIFEHFRDASLKSHQLDPAYYITLPSYSWDCMLKNTNIKLETIQDHDIYLFFENGIRGGISQCMKRRSVANNRYCAGYDPSKRSKYLTYVDANNLYGWAQSQYLPTGGFRWLDRDEIDCLNIETVSDESDVGYVLEVDMEYPQSLHDQHRDLPFLCERKPTPGSKHPKLLTTLENKKNYIAHYRILKQALKHGLKVTTIHRVVRFDQSPWLKPYIDLNTNLRKAAKNDFEKDLFKLYNNSVFGKTMENVRKRLNYKLTTSERKAEKLIAKPNFLHRTIISETMVGINLAKENIVLEKPLYVGMCILELSKELMYKFYYEVIVPHYGEDNVRLIYMDTDSFVIEVYTPDLYESFLPIVYHLDTSSLPKNNLAYQPDNAKVLGKFKDELNGTYIQEFLGVRTKVYCVVKEDEVQDPIKKCKGITKPVVSKILRAEDYRRCIMENEDWYTMNTTFRSYRHDVKTKWENKLTLSGYDFKRHLCADGVNTLPYGHYDIC
ncbi:uncharacterized protein LOC128996535 [Macrosteles quadrilineatus]|uniref:uncharacterized protein LOC128996535 n=1 Tax=Macrosteles quadrilineatus TaxID=74068 RepID=UPI0023E11B8E|nr:uncharacterized protein LOC128996535 [Macrosteles quadrilineatus]